MNKHEDRHQNLQRVREKLVKASEIKAREQDAHAALGQVGSSSTTAMSRNDRGHLLLLSAHHHLTNCLAAANSRFLWNSVRRNRVESHLQTALDRILDAALIVDNSLFEPR